MTPADPNLQQVLEHLSALSEPFWRRGDFWLSLLISLAGTGLSAAGLWAAINAKNEAQKAKDAAKQAGSTVKIQTVVLELQEVAYKLNRLDQSITYPVARDLLNEVAQKVRRLVAPYAKNAELKSTIETLLKSLSDAQAALKSVQPNVSAATDPSPQLAGSVYYGIEGQFMNITGLIGDLVGQLEQMTVPHVETIDGE